MTFSCLVASWKCKSCTLVSVQVTRMIMTTFISLLYVRHLVIPCV
jgi:hypothetical protein